MRLKSIFISEYKNLKDFTLTLEGDGFIDIFVGKNGSGKSNFLEALIEVFDHLYDFKADEPGPGFDYALTYTIDGKDISFRWQGAKEDRPNFFWINRAKRRTTSSVPLPDSARQRAKEAARDADRAEAHAWSLRMEGFGGPAQPSPTIGQCLNGGLGWLEVECNRCKTRASLPLDAIRRPRDTPIWKLEAALKCRSCRKGRYAPPVHMIKLTETREITP
jgi:energy-coupling factor transporter ATP-binding protein EcfA2